MRCKACKERLDFKDEQEPNRPRKYNGRWHCFDCWNELVNGVVNVEHMHNARLYSAGNPSPPDPNPSQENAIRVMEDRS